MSLVLRVEIEKEREGRWIADVVNMPGVLVYGRTPKKAFRAAQALALEVIADRLKHGENPLTGKRAASPPFSGIEFTSGRHAVAR